MYNDNEKIANISSEFKILKRRGFKNLREIPVKELLKSASLFYEAHPNKQKDAEIINKINEVVDNNNKDNVAMMDFIDSCILPIMGDLQAIWDSVEATDE